MSRLFQLLALVSSLQLVSVKSSAWGDESMPAAKIRVMSFNVRYATAADEKNAWPLRSDLLLQTIKNFEPDLLGTQETLPIQAEFLREKLPTHTLIGVGRDDGKLKGEQSALLFRSDRFELQDSGHFWLSEHPDVPGSVSWDSSLPRMVTWAKLKDRSAEGKSFYYLNTHWDHKGQQARVESAKVIRRWLGENAAGQSVILTGDFNATETNEAYAQLVKVDDPSLLLIDSYRSLHAELTPLEATFHGFTGVRNGWRIDWIVYTPHFKATAATIDYTNRDGQYPSDHYPVTSVLEYEK